MSDSSPTPSLEMTNSQTEFWSEFSISQPGGAQLGSNFLLDDMSIPKTPPTPYEEPQDDDQPHHLLVPAFTTLKVDDWAPLPRSISHSKLRLINPLYNVPLDTTSNNNNITSTSNITHPTTSSTTTYNHSFDIQTPTHQIDDNVNNDDDTQDTQEDYDENDEIAVLTPLPKAAEPVTPQEAEQDEEEFIPEEEGKKRTRRQTQPKKGAREKKEKPVKEKKERPAKRAKKEAVAVASPPSSQDSQTETKRRRRSSNTTTTTTTTSSVPASITTSTETSSSPPARVKKGRPTTSTSSSPTPKVPHKQAARRGTPSSQEKSSQEKQEGIASAQIKFIQISAKEQKLELDDLYDVQYDAIENQKKEKFPSLLEDLNKLVHNVEKSLKELDQLLRNVVMQPAEIHNTRELREILQILLVKIDLLTRELTAAMANRAAPLCLAALVILEQPAPKVIFKGKELMTPTHPQYEVVSKVTAALAVKPVDTANTKADKGTPLDDFEQDLDNNIAVLESLTLSVSTRMLPSIVRFAVKLKDRGKVYTLESPPSYPLVCITNESQWAEAVGKLLKEDVLNGEDSSPWLFCANTLQSHFLTITSQDPEDPQRKLYDWELAYIHTKWLGGKNTVTKDMMDKFWPWFGQVLLTIHFKRKVYEMWLEGVIYGFITKEESLEKLKSASEGTFIIRFSESNPGAFAIACTSSDPKDRVKHFLVKPDDLGNAANKTLPDYLRERPQFKTLLVINPENKVVCAVDKEQALTTFYSSLKNKKPVAPTTGYITL